MLKQFTFLILSGCLALIASTVSAQDNFDLSIDPAPLLGAVIVSPVASTATDITCGFQNPIGSVHTGSTPTDCTHTYTQSSQVTLTATANPLYQFVAWQGDCNGFTNSITLTTDQARTCHPLFVPNTSNSYTQISSLSGTQCALQGNGGIQCWGDNLNGELGNNSQQKSATPVNAQGISTAIAISAGTAHTCAVLVNGTAQCWGSNGFGQLGTGNEQSSLIPIDVVKLNTVAAISAGEEQTCAVLANGSVWCWGQGILITFGDRVVGYFNSLGLGGLIQISTPTQVLGIDNAIGIAASVDATCALLRTGRAKCWGTTNNGELGDGKNQGSDTPVDVSNLTSAVTIDITSAHTCAALKDGTARCWGKGGDGRLGTGNLNNAITPQVAASTLTGIIDIAAGHSHSCALLANGNIYCWGNNTEGPLGIGNTQSPQLQPVKVQNISTAIAVSADASRTFAVLADGTARQWGSAIGTTPQVAPSDTLTFTQASDTINAYYDRELFFSPTLSKGIATQWSISGTLPDGLSFSPHTGTLFGTPSASASAASRLTITARNIHTNQAVNTILNINTREFREFTSLTIVDENANPNILTEDAATNTVVNSINLAAFNVGNIQSTVIWSIITNPTPFVISSTSGEITVTRVLSYGEARSYTFTVQALETGGAQQTTQTSITINISNVLESLTIFDSNSSTNTISESRLANAKVSGLELAAFNEHGEFLTAGVEWSLLTSNGFAIDPNTAAITVSGTLDSATTQYSITVKVTATDDRSITDTLPIEIDVEELANTLRLQIKLFLEGPLQ